MQEIIHVKDFLAWLENAYGYYSIAIVDDPGFHWRELQDEELDKLFEAYKVYVEDKPGPGKYEGNQYLSVAEYLDDICGNGFDDEHFGDVDSGLWEGLITIDVPNTIGAPQGHRLFEKIKPVYIVTVDTQGFFTYYEYNDLEEAKSKYMADLAAYESHYASENYSHETV